LGDTVIEAYGYNELKVLVLESIRGGSCSVEDLLSLGSRESIAMALMRYHRMGLLNRYREGRGYVYSLSQRGEERLEYLDELEIIDDDSE
jgi:DNA-binding transcriptional regulator PaaX